MRSKAASNIGFYLGVLRASAGASYVPGAYICGLPRGVQHYLQTDVFRLKVRCNSACIVSDLALTSRTMNAHTSFSAPFVFE